MAGGNFLILGESQEAALAAAEAAMTAIRQLPGVILPFPGGIVRSGSKVGSRYKKLRASTNDAYCPDPARPGQERAARGRQRRLRNRHRWHRPGRVEEATRVGVRAACRPGVLRITAGNYGGKLGPFHLHLHKLLAPA